MCTLAAAYLGSPVCLLEFNELADVDLYDGIFASASVMHLEYERLCEVLPKMGRALHEGGVLYMSFKYGHEDGYLGKRYYTNMDEGRLADLVSTVPQLEMHEMGTFGNEHPDQPSFMWLRALVRKVRA